MRFWTLFVNKSKVEYNDVKDTGEERLKKTFEGLAPVENPMQQKYLGFVISAVPPITILLLLALLLPPSQLPP